MADNAKTTACQKIAMRFVGKTYDDGLEAAAQLMQDYAGSPRNPRIERDFAREKAAAIRALK